MTMLSLHPSKADIKASIGKRLKYVETSAFGNEFKPNGWNVVAGRPSYASMIKREYFAAVLCENGLIVKVK